MNEKEKRESLRLSRKAFHPLKNGRENSFFDHLPYLLVKSPSLSLSTHLGMIGASKRKPKHTKLSSSDFLKKASRNPEVFFPFVFF